MELIHLGLVALLVVVLIAAVVSFAVMGIMQQRRGKTLARKAHAMGMRFSGDDPFEVPRRYATCALMTSGHSPRAHNVTYGRIEGILVRAFDFRYELGHGPRRISKHYSVIVAETEQDMPPVLMWNDRDAQLAPLTARQADGHVGSWVFRGSQQLATMLADAFGQTLADEAASIQVSGTICMVCLPVRQRRQDYAGPLAQAIAKLRALPAFRSARAASAAEPARAPADNATAQTSTDG